MALWPMAQRLRLMARGSETPQSRAGIQSQCSTKVTAAAATALSAARTRRILDQNHSEE